MVHALPSALTLLRYRPRDGRLTLPDVCCDLLWVNGRCSIVGPLRHALPAMGTGQPVSVLRLDPLVARHWIGVPLHELTDRVTELALVDRRLSARMTALFESGGESTLVGPVAHTTPLATDSRVRQARELCHGHRVPAIASAVGLGERQLERLFADRMGLSLRLYRRIVRLRHAVLRAGHGVPLVDVALEAGFADQAHLTRDVRDLTGCTPRALLRHVGNLQDVALGEL